MNKTTLLSVATCLGAALTALAAEPIPMGNENRVIEAGQPYTITMYQPCSGIYTSPADSKIYIDGARDCSAYIDPEHKEPLSVTALGNTGNEVWFTATKGQVIYFWDGFPMNDNTFILYQEGVFDKPLDIISMEPSQNSVVDFNNYPDMKISFNQDIQMEGSDATISFNNRLTSAPESVTVRAYTSGQILRVPMFDNLRAFMASGAIKTNDEFKVTVPGLTSMMGVPYNGADETGDFVMTFRCGSLPVTTTKITSPSVFLSYWPKDAPQGILTMEFNAPLMNDGKTYVELGWGNVEGEGEYYSEIVPVTVKDNTLTANFTGKLRTPANMTPAYPNAFYPTISIEVINVRDEYGVPVASPGHGTTGSYGFNPEYKLIERTNVVGDFEPANGSMLSDVSSVNLYITGLSGISFDGFLFTYVNSDEKTRTTTLPINKVEFTDGGNDDGFYDFTLPAEVKAAKRVTITLDNVVSLDGYEHKYDIRCTYGGFTILSSNPKNGAEIAVLLADTEISITNNLSSTYPSMYVEYQIIDTDPTNPEPVVKTPTWLNRQDNGSYSTIVPQDVKLYAGHDYKFEFTAWEEESIRWNSPEKMLGTDYILIKGGSPAYIYSLVTLAGITPEVGTLISNDLKEIALTFDGEVYLGNYEKNDTEPLRTFIVVGQGIVEPFAYVTPVNPRDNNGVEVALEWVLGLPENYMADLSSPLEISFTAYDQDGVQLRGNMGVEENSFFNFTWGTEGMYDTVEVKAVGSTPLGNVNEFTVFNKDGVNVSYNVPLNEAVVIFGDKEVAHVAEVVMPDIDFSETMTEITLVLDKQLTENGTYTLMIPQDYFVIGEQQAVKSSLAVTYEFNIVAGNAVESINSENTFTVYNAAGLRLLDGADAAAVRALPGGLYIINGRKVMVK